MVGRAAGEGHYARTEREQRWLLRRLPDDLEQPVSIVDLYISGTRLRLRRMEQNGEVVFKLGQKVRPEPEKPEIVKLTNLYLSAHEYDTLAHLGGAEIRKTRWRWAPGGRTMAVDGFREHLAGLVLAEMELDPVESRLPDPPLAVADVTDDDRFSGGTLAQTNPADVQSLLTRFGVTPVGGGLRDPTP